MSERGRRGQETGNWIKPLWDTLSQWDRTQLRSTRDIQAEGGRLGDNALGRERDGQGGRKRGHFILA